MSDTPGSQQSFIHADNVVIGDRSSRLSSAIVVLICIIPIFATILFGAVDNTTWVFISVFWVIVVLLWLADSWRGTGILLDPSVLQIPLIGLLLIGLVQLLPLGSSSGDSALSVPVSHSLSLDPSATRFFLLHLIVYLVYFAACVTFINKEARLRKVVLMVIIFGSVMAFFGILQRLANPDAIYGLRGTAQNIPFGPFINQHHFAAFMEMTAGVALGLLFGKKTKRDKKILLGTAVVVMGVATVFTSSRGGLLGFVSALAFVTILNFLAGRKSSDKRSESQPSSGISRTVSMAAAGAAILLLIFGTVLILGGNEQLFRGVGVSEIKDGISNGRAHFWPIAIRIFLDHPFLGAGLDSFGTAFTKYDTWSGFFRVEQAHNDYLQTLSDAGIAGFLCVAAFIYFLFRRGLAIVGSSSGFRRDAAIGGLAGCFGILIHSFFDFPLRTPSNAFFFLLICAISTVNIHSSKKETPRRRRSSIAH